MILSDYAILQAIEDKDIIITPFNRNNLGSNSYDVTLSNNFSYYIDLAYNIPRQPSKYLDCKKDNKVKQFQIPEEGFILYPGILYLACTNEYTETYNLIPFLEGKSSIGRLGVSIHVTAGKGDIGFKGYWTLEISVIHPVKIYPNMKIGQLFYHTIKGECINPYNKKESAKYLNKDNFPQSSKMYLNFK